MVTLWVISDTHALQLQLPQPIANIGQVMPIGQTQLPGSISQLPIQQGITSQNGIYTNILPQTNQQQNSFYNITPYSSIQNNVYGNTTTTNQQDNNKLYSKERNKSCQVAYAQSNGSFILDLSDTYDINLYGTSIIQDFINKAKEKKYDFVYIDLCNTDVDVIAVAQWHQLLKQNNIQVMWNLSNNNSINDYIIYYLDLNNIKGLNISNTKVSANGISYLCTLLQNCVDSTIQFINICGLNVPNAKVLLHNAFMQHVALWQQKNSSKEYTSHKTPIIDSYDDTSNNLIPISNNLLNTQQYNVSNLQVLNQQPVLQPVQYNNTQSLNANIVPTLQPFAQTLPSNPGQTMMSDPGQIINSHLSNTATTNPIISNTNNGLAISG